MFALVFVALLLVGPADQPAVVAMVLSTRGNVSVTRPAGKAGRLAVMDQLRAGDQVSAEPGAEATLWILYDGWHETVRPGARVTLGPRGCAPAGAITRSRPRLPRQNLDGLREAVRADRIGGVGLREPGEKTPAPRVTPFRGTTLLTERPAFAWPHVEGAQEYHVLLLSGAEGPDERRLWKATAAEPRLAYPKAETPLRAGRKYRWRVTARVKDDEDKPVVAGMFFVATRREAETLAGLRPLAESNDPVDELLAATGYEAHGVLEESMRLYERLAAQAPKEACYQETLARFYERAGRPDRAKAARARALELKSSPRDR